MDIAIPVRRGETQTELTIRTVARPERHVAELLVHLGLELPTRNRILAAPPDGKRRRNRANVVQKSRVRRPETRINTEPASATCGTWASFAEGLRLLVNHAMQAERSHVLQAQPFERTDARLGHANGFKPKTLKTRMGPITFAVPQVRGEVEFYPSALEKGIRSEQALKLALAEMYVQGVSTRKVAAILEELCGTSVSSTHVSQCAARLDADLLLWRTRPLGTFAHVLLDARYEKVRHGGRVLDCAVLIALGIASDGKRQILWRERRPERSRSPLARLPREPPATRPLRPPAPRQ
jgi:hypothetical protein